MLNLSIIYLAINVILVITLVFANAFEARKKTTAILPVVVIFYLVYLFDSYINKSRIQEWCVKVIGNLKILTIPNIPEHNSTLFIVGVLIILEIFVIALMLYSLYANLFSYTPPLLLSNKEKRAALGNAILWKSLLFISVNLLLLFVLRTVNEIMQLPYGFLEPLFKLGVRL